jgi:CCR4-NOT transcription complex subunit 4
VDEHLLRASFGTTKYCTFFLKSADCPNKECLYLHSLADEEDIVHRDDMSNKNVFYDQQLLAMKIANIFDPDVKKKLLQLSSCKKVKPVFPPIDSIYTKDIVINEDPSNFNKNKYYNYHSKKKFEYDDFSYYNDNLQNSNDDVEYILVREDKNRIHSKNFKKLSQSPRDSDTKILKVDLQETNKGYSKSLSPDSRKVENVSTSDVTTNHSSETAKTEKKLYRKSDKSRFDFVKNSSNSGDEVVPEFISDMLYKKISRYTFFKKLGFDNNDKSFFEKELDHNDSWAQFIKSNISKDS